MQGTLMDTPGLDMDGLLIFIRILVVVSLIELYCPHLKDTPFAERLMFGKTSP